VDEARARVARFFGAPDPTRVIFAANASGRAQHVIQAWSVPETTSWRPASTTTPCCDPSMPSRSGGPSPSISLPSTSAGFRRPGRGGRRSSARTRGRSSCATPSNVLGTLQPVAEIARRCAERGVPLVVDAAQSAGQVPIDMAALGIAALAFTGHKALYGPSGIGGLVLMPDVEIETTRFGGTGMDSASLVHSQAYPLRLEVGTLN